jgi:Co/Zn/Cd efflux system component
MYYDHHRRDDAASLTLLPLAQIDGVRSVSHVHVWELYEDKAVATAHLAVAAEANAALVMIRAKMALSKCSIHASTLEVTVLAPAATAT